MPEPKGRRRWADGNTPLRGVCRPRSIWRPGLPRRTTDGSGRISASGLNNSRPLKRWPRKN